ncbi:hypothetical protein QBC42DRAFT_284951 [Cladorrhinum samala]|uniref:Secreted protein n=1 Tax=Cladorrhinum samala TaxID=585594 RepID=A0AAV9HST0_9PEZI|nr:hypothetical protein QBC42DRAFT_284951 [Cladorrhinum samala]
MIRFISLGLSSFITSTAASAFFSKPFKRFFSPESWRSKKSGDVLSIPWMGFAQLKPDGLVVGDHTVIRGGGHGGLGLGNNSPKDDGGRIQTAIGNEMTPASSSASAAAAAAGMGGSVSSSANHLNAASASGIPNPTPGPARGPFDAARMKTRKLKIL